MPPFVRPELFILLLFVVGGVWLVRTLVRSGRKQQSH
jgi:flagellar biogenesis protein FliO